LAVGQYCVFDPGSSGAEFLNGQGPAGFPNRNYRDFVPHLECLVSHWTGSLPFMPHTAQPALLPLWLGLLLISLQQFGQPPGFGITPALLPLACSPGQRLPTFPPL
jgi:hypothetical protein